MGKDKINKLEEEDCYITEQAGKLYLTIGLDIIIEILKQKNKQTSIQLANILKAKRGK